MNTSDRIATAKPYLIGGVLGAIAISVIGFAGGLVVSTGTLTAELHSARIAALSEVCAVSAKQHWLDTGNEMAALEGWSNDARERLAEQFTPAVAGVDSIRADIVDECGDALRPA